MKKICSLSMVLLFFIGTLFTTSCADDEIFTPKPKLELKQITLTPEAKDLVVGESFKVTPIFTPEKLQDIKLTWKSSNEHVASVSKSGEVKAIAEGVAEIVAQAPNGIKSSSCTVKVGKAVVHVDSVHMVTPVISLFVGETGTVYVNVLPINADNKEVTWSSSDEKIAKVNKGKVTAVAKGIAYIIVTSVDGGIQAKSKIIVSEKPIPVSSLSLNKRKHTMKVNESFKLIATISPSDATNQKVIWESMDETVCKVDSTGTVTALKPGVALISATSSEGGKYDTCMVTVEDDSVKVTAIQLNKTDHTMMVGDIFTLTTVITPANATNKEIEWTSSDEKVAKVENGKVTALEEGTATITAKSKDGSNVSASAKISVEKLPDGLTIGDIPGKEF